MQTDSVCRHPCRGRLLVSSCCSRAVPRPVAALAGPCGAGHRGCKPCPLGHNAEKVSGHQPSFGDQPLSLWERFGGRPANACGISPKATDGQGFFLEPERAESLLDQPVQCPDRAGHSRPLSGKEHQGYRHLPRPVQQRPVGRQTPCHRRRKSQPQRYRAPYPAADLQRQPAPLRIELREPWLPQPATESLYRCQHRRAAGGGSQGTPGERGWSRESCTSNSCVRT